MSDEPTLHDPLGPLHRGGLKLYCPRCGCALKEHGCALVFLRKPFRIHITCARREPA